jgi:segregation and condensation protein B
VRKLLAAKPPRLSRPLLETLAIIAYRQPITRPEIEQLRGVDCGGVLDTLIERRLVKIAGRKDAPGRPMVYASTPEFLETFGLKDLEQLPDLGELREIDAAIGEMSSVVEPESEMSPQLELIDPVSAEPQPALEEEAPVDESSDEPPGQETT